MRRVSREFDDIPPALRDGGSGRDPNHDYSF